MSKMIGSEPPQPARNRNVHWLWLSMLVIVADQFTKALIRKDFNLYDVVQINDFFNLVRLHNTGAAFSLFSEAGGMQKWFFVLLAVAVSIGIMIWLRRHPRGEKLMAVSLCLILAGALGNVIDRVHLGYVVDFLDVHVCSLGWTVFGYCHWPAFNVADIAICIGAVCIVLDSFLTGRRQRLQAKEEANANLTE